MSRFDCSIVIKRPVEDVFAVMSDFSNGSKWASVSAEPAVKTSDGPIGVGSTWHAVGKVVGRKIETDFEYTEFEVDRKIAYIDAATAVPDDGHGHVRAGCRRNPGQRER